VDVFFKPKSVAVLGVSRNPRKDGNNILRNLMMRNSLKLYPINPFADEILGIKAYPSVLDVPNSIDLAIIFVPPDKALQAVKDCVKKPVKAILIESSGFNEVGNWQLFDEIRKMTKEAGIRVWGPNCTGYVDFHEQLYTSFARMEEMLEDLDVEKLKGNVSLISQSGMIAGGMMFEIISGKLLKINKICAIGNKLDINECDILEFLASDPNTEVIGMYLEGFADGKRFLKLAREITAKKPIVLLKGGQSESGSKAAMSHTGSISGKSEHLEGIFKQVGIIQVDDFMELLNVLNVLSMFKENEIAIPARARVQIVTISGGAGVVLSDHVEKDENLSLATHSEKTKQKIAKAFPEWMVTGRENPCDIWPAIEIKGPFVISDIVTALLKDENIDIIVMTIFAARIKEWKMFQKELFGKFTRRYKKPVFCWILGEYTEFDSLRIELSEVGIPLFWSIQTLMSMVSKTCSHGSYLNKK